MTQYKNRLKITIFTLMGMTVSTLSFAAHDPAGFWKSEDGRAKVQFGPCASDASKICGKIIDLKWPIDPVTQQPKLDKHNPDSNLQSRPLMGLEIVKDFYKDDEPNKWTGGTIYSPREGKTYTAEFTMADNNTLALRGYVFVPLLGKTQTWTRVDQGAPMNPANESEPSDK